MPASFYDTNVLVYIASGDAAKADRSEAAIAAGGAISVQVLNELTNVARRKMQMSWADTHAFLNLLRGLLTVHAVTVETHETGLKLAERYGFSTYDAMIAASALHAGCDTLWSEDMQHGMTLAEGLRIVNPFRVAG
jgi:predicted nucleic acid-binding protein